MEWFAFLGGFKASDCGRVVQGQLRGIALVFPGKGWRAV